MTHDGQCRFSVTTTAAYRRDSSVLSVCLVVMTAGISVCFWREQATMGVRTEFFFHQSVLQKVVQSLVSDFFELASRLNDKTGQFPAFMLNGRKSHDRLYFFFSVTWQLVC